MRAASRSLVVVLAVLMSAVAVPAYAGDDSPGLLDTVNTTVNTLLAPKPAPTPVATTPKPAGPVKQLTKIVDTALGGHTALSETPLVETVDSVLSGPTLPSLPSLPAVSQQVPEAVGVEPVNLVAPSGQVADRVAAATARTASVSSITFAADVAAFTPSKVAPTTSDEGHVPGTSTLPDGGSSLTLAWLVLWVGVTATGAVVVRRARASL